METKLFEIKGGFAKRNKLPRIFAGVVLKETANALFVYGHGTVESAKTGRCCICGRTLTHPVSITLGIGPVCGQHFWDWNLVGGFSEENAARLKKEIGTLMRSMKIDSWIPRSVVIETLPTIERVFPPSNHIMLKPQDSGTPTPPVKRQATFARYKNGDLAIKIEFPYDRDDVAKVKDIPGRKYNPDHKVWTCPVSPQAIEMLKGWGFLIDPRLLKFLDESQVNIDELEDPENIEGLKMKLYPYQEKGVAFIEAKKGRALIADEMRLGKTAEALAWLQMHPKKRPVLIIVPASLKLNWERETFMWMSDPSVSVLSGTTPNKGDLVGADIVIINYDILADWLKVLIAHNFVVIIADEVHYVKNNSAKRTKAIKKIAKTVKHFIALSGTPIVNRPIEFYNAISMIDRNLFPDFWHYVRTYCGARHNGFGWDFSRATNSKELHEKLIKSLMIRRLKVNVLTDLPDKVRSFFPVEMDSTLLLEYQAAENDFIEYVRRVKGDDAADRASSAEQLSSIEALKQLAVKAKMPSLLTWVQDFLDSGEKLVLFATHKFVIDEVMERFGKLAVKIDGSVSGGKRQEAVDRFQNEPETRLFVGNIKAAGVGITLTTSSNVAFIELPWTPGDLIQAEDRCHRIGQKNSVNIYYLLAKNTIEEKIALLLDDKRKVLNAVLDGKAPEEGSLLTELMESYMSG